ncbi:MAG: D-lysine 5,6-aminomutase subunit alpha, partial [Elusimicrobia bacterium]|nr:D-lysine 5,6-aminomutase subunit alpha [Elusimicrobiota bacterium]
MKPAKSKLGLSSPKTAKARALAADIVAPVQEFIDRHTTVTIERATLRLLGADGANSDGVPVPNLIAGQCAGRLAGGAAAFYINALIKLNKTPAALNEEIAKGLD